MRFHQKIPAMFAAAFIAVSLSAAMAAEFPEQAIEYIIPFGPGGESDITARHQQAFFKGKFNQDLVISYKPGGGGAVGWSQLNSLKGDGYTVMGVNLPHIVIKPRQKNVGFETDDITIVYIAFIGIVSIFLGIFSTVRSVILTGFSVFRSAIVTVSILLIFSAANAENHWNDDSEATKELLKSQCIGAKQKFDAQVYTWELLKKWQKIPESKKWYKQDFFANYGYIGIGLPVSFDYYTEAFGVTKYEVEVYYDFFRGDKRWLNEGYLGQQIESRRQNLKDLDKIVKDCAK